MSQNKTRFPGMNEGQGRESNSVYSRDAYNPQNEGGRPVGRGERATRIPELENSPKGQKQPSNNGKPIRGFLYSISKGVVGEFWPLHQGKNTIGSSPKCDICLPEATVSEEHASLTIRILENQEKTIASLKDTDSTNGTKINGEDVDFDANKCKDGDIIRFGSSYECLLILIDTKERGLKVAENFIPTDEEVPVVSGGFVPEDNNEPIFYQEQGQGGTRGMQAPQGGDGTRGMDGGPYFGGDSHHRTVGM